MLLDRATLEAIHAGRITQVFRRWKRAAVRAGSQRKTALGVLDIVACDMLRDDEVTDAQARAAGYSDRATLLNDRQLKELGLTESLEVGYRLSPRGESLLRARGG